MSTVLPAPLSVAGFTAQVAPLKSAGSVQANWMGELKPSVAPTVRAALPDCPGAAMLMRPALRLKSSTDSAAASESDSLQSESPE